MTHRPFAVRSLVSDENSGRRRVRTVVIEQWSILRSGIRTVLTQGGHAVLATADSAVSAFEAIRSADGVELAIVGAIDCAADVFVQDLAKVIAGVRSLVFLDHPSRASIDALLGAGAAGIVDHTTEGPQLLDAVERIHRGERVLSNPVIDVLAGVSRRHDASADRRRDTLQEAAGGVPLTDREREILGCLRTGGTNRDIAAHLYIGESTVKSHLGSAYAKLGVANRQQALIRAAELGFVSVGS
jgi:DNA-binding NarL/FixJ family response regulator